MRPLPRDILECSERVLDYHRLSKLDERSPAALARRLAEVTTSPALRELAGGLVDGDVRLATAMRTSPTVAGLVLEPEKPGELPPAEAAE